MMKVTVNRLTKVYRQFLDGQIAYFDLGKFSKKFRRPLLWFLQKLGLKLISEEEYLPAETIQLDDVIEQIYANKAILEAVLNREAKYLLVGHDVMQRIGMRYIYGAVQVPSKIESRNPSLNHRIAGLQVVFIPYMEGMLVVQDLNNMVPEPIQSATFSVVESVPDLELL